MSKEILLCKDCVHSHMDLIYKIATLNGRLFDDEIHYKCNKFVRPEMEVVNMVVGPEKLKAQRTFCEIARDNPNKCGADAKHWQPKHKKDLFKMLTKENND